MLPFQFFCPRLAITEVRTIIVTPSCSIPADEYDLQEAYCHDRHCDCRRVMIKVVSQQRQREEANISFGFDRDDPMRGPFLDPINYQGPYADGLLKLVSSLLESDTEYVARLERHYRITKDIVNCRIHPDEAQPSSLLSAATPLSHVISGRIDDYTSDSGERSGSEQRPMPAIDSIIELGELAGFNMKTPEGIERFLKSEFGEEDSGFGDKAVGDAGDRRPAEYRKSLRQSRKRQRQSKKRNRR